jgi:hypothetical protein
MSVLVITTVQADRAAFERMHAEREDDLRAVMKDAKAAGAVHHRFGVRDDGTVLIVDEWQTAEAAQAFIGNHAGVASLMQGAGVTAPPTTEIVDAFDSVDEF